MPRNNPAFYLPCRFHLRLATLCSSVRFNYESPLFTPLAELSDSILFFQLTLSFSLPLFSSLSRPDPCNGGLETDLPSASALRESLPVSFFFRARRELGCNRYIGSFSTADADPTASRKRNYESAIRKSDSHRLQLWFFSRLLGCFKFPRCRSSTNFPLCFFGFETARQRSRINASSLRG